MSVYIHLHSIQDVFKFFQLEHPIHHPLIGVVDFSKIKEEITEDMRVGGDIYCLIFKTYCRNNVKYGRKVVDFSDGSLICLAPNQLLEMDNEIEAAEKSGWGLFFHPDLIRGTALGDKMDGYSFFSYEVSEALHMSEKEKQILYECVQKIEAELQENIDVHSQSIIVAGLELLLNYCQRFYGRQFITRKSSNNTVVAQTEKILKAYFSKEEVGSLPTVKYLAEQVHLSPSYLSDLLKKETGKNAQDHIHFYLIEEAKSVLLSTNKSVSEIAYSLGFEYPQYFNKLFKQKTGKTPVEYRSVN